MRYYKEAEQLKKQQKYQRQQQQQIQQAQDNMRISQIMCRTLRYCNNAETQLCMYCKWNKTCIQPRGDYYKPKVPGLKVLP